MTKKDEARAKGREIRRKTGIPLPLAMLAGKKIVRGKSHEISRDSRFADFLRYVPGCGDGCCSGYSELEGPKGDYPMPLF